MGVPVRLFLLMLAISGCQTEEIVFSDLNAVEDDCLSIEVRALADAEEPGIVEGDLHRANGDLTGSWSVDPAVGPVNTVHLFRVHLDASLDAEVDRVLLVSDNNFDNGGGGVGPTEWVLDPVSGQSGGYDIPLASGGSPDTDRTDTFCVHAQRQES